MENRLLAKEFALSRAKKKEGGQDEDLAFLKTDTKNEPNMTVGTATPSSQIPKKPVEKEVVPSPVDSGKNFATKNLTPQPGNIDQESAPIEEISDEAKQPKGGLSSVFQSALVNFLPMVAGGLFEGSEGAVAAHQGAQQMVDAQQQRDLAERKMQVSEQQQQEGVESRKALDNFRNQQLDLDRQALFSRAAQGGGGEGRPALNLTKGDISVDQKFAPDYNEWTSGGGDVALNEINKLKGVADRLRSKEVTTGGLTGMFPDRITSEKVLSARADIESTIMKSLRALLGAQFTEKEGQRVINATWNEADTTENNLERVNRLVSDLESQAKAKNAKAHYFQQHGTLKGFSNNPALEEARKRGLL